MRLLPGIIRERVVLGKASKIADRAANDVVDAQANIQRAAESAPAVRDGFGGPDERRALLSAIDGLELELQSANQNIASVAKGWNSHRRNVVEHAREAADAANTLSLREGMAKHGPALRELRDALRADASHAEAAAGSQTLALDSVSGGLAKAQGLRDDIQTAMGKPVLDADAAYFAHQTGAGAADYALGRAAQEVALLDEVGLGRAQPALMRRAESVRVDDLNPAAEAVERRDWGTAAGQLAGADTKLEKIAREAQQSKPAIPMAQVGALAGVTTLAGGIAATR